jgi:hypothetical protein
MRAFCNALCVVVSAAQLLRCFAAQLREEPRPSVRELTENNINTKPASYKGAWTPGTVIEDQADTLSCTDDECSFYDSDTDQQPFLFGKMGSIARETNFKKVQQFKADYTEAEFTQYESQRTGMSVVVVDRKGPKIYGYFALATEIHDDSGAREYTQTSSPFIH